VLTGLVKRIDREATCVAIEDPEVLQDTVGSMKA
jgi:hypothetical protein